jgi:glutaredoxin
MKAIVWSKYHCPYCDKAKALLKMRGVEFEERKIGDGYTKEELFDDKLIGGYTELEKYFKEAA